MYTRVLICCCCFFVALLAEGLEPQPMGERALGLGLTEGQVGFDRSFAIAQDLGVSVVELAQQWDEVDQGDGQLRSPILMAANKAFAQPQMSVVLSLNPIDTNRSRRPLRFAQHRFSDPACVVSFCSFVDFVVASLPDCRIKAIAIGNEIDAYLGEDQEGWQDYAKFLAAIRRHVKTKHQVAVCGAKMTWQASEALSKLVLAQSDALMMTYYPLDKHFQVRGQEHWQNDIQGLIARAEQKPLYLMEIGFPSSVLNNSSEHQQAEFIKNIFAIWDKHAATIPYLNIVWLHDLPPKQVDQLVQYYQGANKSFRSFLESLGLRCVDGKAKLGFKQLSYELSVRK